MSLPRRSSLPDILSISSMKTIPSFSTALMASRVMRSLSSSLSLSSSISTLYASPTVIFLVLYLSPKGLPIKSPRLIIPIWAPGMPGMSMVGMEVLPLSRTLISISLSLSWFSRSSLRNFCLVSSPALTPTNASSTRSSAAISALAATLLRISSLVVCSAFSNRSRMMDSTSRPT